MPYEYRCRNSQQNTSKPNYSTLKGLYIMNEWDLFQQYNVGSTQQIDQCNQINGRKKEKPCSSQLIQKNVCDKSKYIFMIKTFRKLGGNRKFLDIIKDIYKKIHS